MSGYAHSLSLSSSLFPIPLNTLILHYIFISIYIYLYISLYILYYLVFRYTHIYIYTSTRTYTSSKIGSTGPGGGVILVDEACVEHILSTKFDNYVKGPLIQSILEPFLGQGVFFYLFWITQKTVIF